MKWYVKQDLFMVLILCSVIFGIGGIFYLKDLSYSQKEDKTKEILKEETFTYDFDKELKNTNYSVDEIYKSIEKLSDSSSINIDDDLNDIYVDFYSYFDGNNVFINMNGESYNYDEYTFIQKYYNGKNDKVFFGINLVTKSKCDIFSNVSNDSRKEMLDVYCKK